VSKQDKSGGQAFPRAGFEGDSMFSNPRGGMTLRAYFAGSLVAGEMATGDGIPITSKYIGAAFDLAEAMVAEELRRQKEEGGAS